MNNYMQLVFMSTGDRLELRTIAGRNWLYIFFWVSTNGLYVRLQINL